MDGKTGSITPGKYADLVVLDTDILRVDPGDVGRARVDYTILEGRVVYERGAD